MCFAEGFLSGVFIGTVSWVPMCLKSANAYMNRFLWGDFEDVVYSVVKVYRFLNHLKITG